VTGVIEQFGALGVFLLMVPESACIPIPSEVTLLFSGFAVHQGWMSLPLAVLAATAGNLVGSLLAYGLGASRLVERVPIVRSVLHRWDGLLARLGTFVVLTAAGCALWALALVLTGVFVGAAWMTVDSAVGRALLVVGLLTLVLTMVRRRAE
jgi:membrane protein DedA with SNARE-associated domain